MDEFRPQSKTRERRRPSPLPFDTPDYSNADAKCARAIEPESPFDTSFDASGEPLMDDAHINIITRSGTVAPNTDTSSRDHSPHYTSFSGAMREAMSGKMQTQNPRISLRKLDTHAKHASTSSTIYTGPPSPLPHDDSPLGSISTASTAPTDYSTLPMLQTKGPPDEIDRLEQINVDDPTNFDLLESAPDETQAVYQLESRADQLFSADHLYMIFRHPKLLLQFTGFLNSYRPMSVRTLNLYLDALKAIRAINYANAVARSLAALESVPMPHEDTVSKSLMDRAERAFKELARNDLPAWITYTWTQIVSVTIQRRITGTLAPHLREASEGLAEVFCLSDPSRPDNPIVFASEEFQRTTQYGLTYCVGRNCRFLQGPRTNKSSVERLAQAVRAGKEHSETFLNYRRDGSPFMNLLMIAPLLDSQGRIRYFIGAQVDVSGFAKECVGLEGLQRLVARDADRARAIREDELEDKKDAFQRLSEILNGHELETVRKYGGKMHEAQVDDRDDGVVDDDDDDDDGHRSSAVSNRPRLLLTDPTGEELDARARRLPPAQAAAMRTDIAANGRLQGVYQNYLLVRPAPTLRILFTSPSLRIPGILQSSLMTRIGGSPRVRGELQHAFEEGRGVTAKVRWLTRARDPEAAQPSTHTEEGRSRWLHCTPLLGHTGKIGVWMVVLVDEDTRPGDAQRRFRVAPPIAPQTRSRDADRAVIGSGGSSSKRSSGAPRYPSGVALDALRINPPGTNGNQTESMAAGGGKRTTGGTESKTSSIYGVVADESGNGAEKVKRVSKEVTPVSPVSIKSGVSGVSRPQSVVSFALR